MPAGAIVEAAMELPFNEMRLDALTPPQPGTAPIALYDTTPGTPDGFGGMLGPKGITFCLRLNRDGKRSQEKIARRARWVILGGERVKDMPNGMTLDEARREATKRLGLVAGGSVTPGDQLQRARKGMTLRQAILEYVEYLKQDDARHSSIDSIEREMLRYDYLQDWLDRPLRSLTPAECYDRHRKIGATGPYVANRVFSNLSTVWERAKHVARRLDPTDEWGENPVVIDKFPSHRRQEPIPWSKLAGWWALVNKITNPDRRVYNLLVLFTGLRRTDARLIRKAHMNLTDKPVDVEIWDKKRECWVTKELGPHAVFRPIPKGGPEKAFAIPLPWFLVQLITQLLAQRTEDDGGWLFPSIAAFTKECAFCEELGIKGGHVRGQVTHMLSNNYISRKRTKRRGLPTLPSPHRLRDTYCTAMDEIPGLPPDIQDSLMNHRRSNRNIGSGYKRHHVESLRRWQDRITNLLWAAIKGQREEMLRLLEAQFEAEKVAQMPDFTPAV